MVNKKLVKTLFILLTIMMIALAGLEIKSFLDTSQKNNVVVDTMNIGPYKVSVKQTALEKEIGNELKTALDSKEQNAIVQQVSRYFVADYFTLNDKVSVNDIGGLSFVLVNNKKEFKTNAINSYYGDVPIFREVFGQKNLPVVESVSAEKVKKYDLNKLKINKSEDSKAKEAYSVNLSWKYMENEKLDTSDIVNKGQIILVKDQDNNLFIFSLIGVK